MCLKNFCAKRHQSTEYAQPVKAEAEKGVKLMYRIKIGRLYLSGTYTRQEAEHKQAIIQPCIKNRVEIIPVEEVKEGVGRDRKEPDYTVS